MLPCRPTTRCCRAVQQHIRAPLESIWITDSVLASAFERYCYVSRLTRRNSSSVPGPLESRKRLGKRRMTDLRMDNQSTLPAWAIQFPVDLSQWKWQPPTLRSSEAKGDLLGQHGQSAMPRIPKRKGDNAWHNDEGGLRTMDEIFAPESMFLEKLSKARLAVAASTPEAIESAFYSFIGGLQQDLKLGVIDPEAVATAMSTFPNSLVDTVANCELANAAVEMFLSAVVNGIATSKVLGPSEFGSSFWNQLLKQISALQATEATTLLFQTTLEAMPLSCVNDVHEGLVAAVRTLVVSRSTRRGCRRAADIGGALRELSPVTHDALLRKMEAAVFESSAAFQEGSGQGIRFVWLQVLAHMPQVKEDYLFDACVRSTYFDRGTVGRDLGQLLIQQWTSRGYLRRHRILEGCWNRDSRGRKDLGLAALVVNICKLEHPCMALLFSLWKALRRVGYEEELMISLENYCETRKKLNVMPFKHVAVTSLDPSVALRMLSLLDSHATKLDSTVESTWDWTAWEPYMEHLIKDECVSTVTIWRLVNSGNARNYQDAAQRELLMKRRTRLMEYMAVWFSQAQHFTDRMAVREVSQCIGWLRAHEVKLSRRVLAAIASVVIRELKRAEPGRTRRMEWVLDLVEQYEGPEERRAVAQILRRWRKRNQELKMIKANKSATAGP